MPDVWTGRNCSKQGGPAGVDTSGGALRLPAPLLAGLADYTIAGWVKVSGADI